MSDVQVYFRARWIALGGVLLAVAGPMAYALSAKRPVAPIEPAAEIAQGTPKLLVESPEHDFGALDPTEECEHTFVVRNFGDAPLTLEKVGTSCKCTVSELPDGKVPPGGQTTIRLASKIKQKEGVFFHSAMFRTNDPAHRELTLSMRGCVRIVAACEPRALTLARPGAGQPSQGEVLVYSQVHPDFELEVTGAGSPGLHWQVRPADPGVLKQCGARQGYRLEATLDAEPAQKPFVESLRLVLKPKEEGAQPREFKLDVGNTPGATMELHGEHVVLGETLRMGIALTGERRVEHLTLKVRDKHRELDIREIETVPDFLRVKVEPYSQESQKIGLYHVEVEVPADAPPCGFMGVRMGRFKIHTDHPRVPVMSMGVEFAVIPREESLVP